MKTGLRPRVGNLSCLLGSFWFMLAGERATMAVAIADPSARRPNPGESSVPMIKVLAAATGGQALDVGSPDRI